MDNLFIAVHTTGLVYCDKAREQHGDYLAVAYLSYTTLALEWRSDCAPEMRQAIEKHASSMQARRGERFQISTCGQYVTLGGERPRVVTLYGVTAQEYERIKREVKEQLGDFATVHKYAAKYARGAVGIRPRKNGESWRWTGEQVKRVIEYTKSRGLVNRIDYQDSDNAAYVYASGIEYLYKKQEVLPC